MTLVLKLDLDITMNLCTEYEVPTFRVQKLQPEQLHRQIHKHTDLAKIITYLDGKIFFIKFHQIHHGIGHMVGYPPAFKT